MTYAEAVTYLESLVDFERLGFRRHFADTVNLDSIRALLELLDNPQHGLPCVHIAGTKGKGSTAAILESISAAAGLQVGLFSSPHLVSFRERIRIGQQMVSEEEMAWAVAQVCPAIERLREEGKLNPSTFFEAYTAMAYLLFRKHGVDLAIMEVGLGGRLDATNTCEPVACAITTLGLDHTEILGETIEQIAREKAGIMKPGVPCVTAPQDPAAMAVLQEVAQAVGARLEGPNGRAVCGHPTPEPETGDTAAGVRPLQLALFGEHQRTNLAVALGLVDLLREQGYGISEEAVRQGCREVRWPGRLQIVGEKPWIVLDVAHNEAAARALVAALPQMIRYHRLIAVLGLSAEKDARAFCRVLAPLVDVAVLTRAQIERALPADELANLTAGMWRQSEIEPDARAAVRRAGELARPQDCILITGSFYVVGEVMEVLRGGTAGAAGTG
jgi:dihydrofolate synthase / folylpolyglutamate synthase